MMKKALFLFLLALSLLLISCENFMNGSDIQEQLNEMIDVANAKSYTIIVSQDTTMGSFLSSGDKTCKVGQTINVQYTVKKDLYIYKGLKAVNVSDETKTMASYVEFTQTDGDDTRGVYKTTIKLIKESDDIFIVPECVLVPNAVKEECKPENKDNGVEQDSTIAIVFNKAIKLTDYFAPVITDASGQSLADYYGNPYLSADNLTLYIPTNKDIKLLDPNGDIETKDIIVKLDLSNIQDLEGNKGSAVFQHKYRVNKTHDTKKPVFTNANLFSTSDTESPYYKELTAKVFPNEWSAEGAGNGDYGKNHIGGSVYIEVQGKDEESGIGKILVKEKILKYTDGSAADSSVVETYMNCTFDEDAGIYSCNYDIKTLSDGIIELEILLVDNAENISQTSKKFYVVKDTIIEAGSVKFTQEFGQFPDTTAGWKAAIPVVTGDTQNIVLTLNSSTKDKYYADYSSEYEIKAFWGYSEDSITEPLTKNADNSYSFTRDVNRFVYIKLLCKDEVGTEKEIIKHMAPRPEITQGEQPESIEMVNMKSLLVLSNITTNSQDSVLNYARFFTRFYDDPQDASKYTEVISNGSTLGGMIDYYAPIQIQAAWNLLDRGNELPLGSVRVYMTSTIGDFPTPLSLNYLFTTITDSNGAIEEPIISSESAESNYTVIEAAGPEGKAYIKNNFKIKTEPVKSSGCYKISVSDYMTDAGKADNIVYSFYAIKVVLKDNAPDQPRHYAFYTQTSARSKSPEFFLDSESKYLIYLDAYDNTNKKKYSPYPFKLYASEELDENGFITNSFFTEDNPPKSCSFYVDSATSPTNILSLTQDLSAPYITGNVSFEGEVNPFAYAGYYQVSVPQEGEGEESYTSLFKNEKGNYELTYYIIPNSSNNIKFIPYYTINELKTSYAAYKKTIEYEPAHYVQNETENWVFVGDSKINIPFENLREGFYTISLITEDENGNTGVVTYPFINSTIGRLPYTLELKTEEQDVGEGMSPILTYYYDFKIDTSKSSVIKAVQKDEKTLSSIDAYLSMCNYDNYENKWNWEPQSTGNNVCYATVQNQTHVSDIVQEVSYTQKLYINQNSPWRRLTGYYGFNDSDTALGKGFYYTEYIYLARDKECKMKNCLEGLNGLQIFSDNTVLVHTMYSKEKVTESKYDKDAYILWETKGTETGLIVYPSSHSDSDGSNNQNDPYGYGGYSDPNEQDSFDFISRTYGLENLDKIPSGYWYTTILHFADGTVVMTDIKQKQ